MGIVVPRPAMRAREERMIRARIRYYDDRRLELEAAGLAEEAARKQAFQEARHLRFNRKGERCP